MDCCNYMQYRHHQPYYGSQFYDPLPTYHGDFYGQQMYPEYYGNSPYYPQQWPCAASFPDYVYNPKEARIRKAMRDATRERSIGASPMLPRPNARRAHNWVSSHEELMMSPLTSMRPTMEPPVCGGFPLPSTGNGQFMATMNGYNKLEPPMSSAGSVHTNYMQSNPLAQLQQHAEMWDDYQNAMCPKSPGNPFMMADISSYHPQPQEVPENRPVEKQPRMSAPVPVASSAGMTSPRLNENIPPEELTQKSHHDVGDFENKGVMDGAQPSMESGQDPFMPLFDQNDVDRRPFEKIEEAKIKKPTVPHQIRNNTRKPGSKPLPDFNEAFGSTERGRFQSPPDPRLAPNKGYLDYFFESNPMKFDDYQI